MLYVPKAHRADVLALDPATAAAFAAYIGHQGPRMLLANGGTASSPAATPAVAAANGIAPPAPTGPAAPTTTQAAAYPPTQGVAEGFEIHSVLPLTDLSAPSRGGNGIDATELPAEPQALPKPAGGGASRRVPIDFLTGDADGISWMTPLLLPLVHKRSPARQLVNVVMQLPETIPAEADPRVRLAKEADIPQLNRWRRLYKEERGIVFDADMGALIEHQRVFVYEVDKQIVAVAKIDLELQRLVEMGGVYTFPEFRNRGYGAGIVRDLATRIRAQRKTPTLQVDVQNTPALQLYEKAGWQPMGKLARVWLTG
jgi:GNAT superfamily N-acetyltransferase